MINGRAIVTAASTVLVPIIICIPIAKLTYKNEFLLQNLDNLLSGMIGIMATLFGFVLTALSILLAFEGNEKTKQLRKSRHYKTILGTYLIAAYYMLISLIVFTIFHSYKILNDASSFTYVFFTAISFVYLMVSVYYLSIMILTLFYKKVQYH